MRPATHTPTARAFLALDAVMRACEPMVPRFVRASAIAKAMHFTTQRLNGEDGLGAIFPAMVNSLCAYDALGFGKDDKRVQTAWSAIRKLLVHDADESYCQPCVSPIWDTALAVHALFESGGPRTRTAIADANRWLRGRQVLDVAGDWSVQRPGLRPGGWAFQYWNDYYPDVDDTGVVAMALEREGRDLHRDSLERAAEWIVGMQSSDGGWGAFDADNTSYYLNHIPFADHGALLDPPTEDVTARCVGFLLQFGYSKDNPTVAAGLDYLRRTQQPDGSWFGRWGTNYIYGTWSVLNAFIVAGETSANSQTVKRAVDYLLRFQQPDGGWGEDGGTYWPEQRGLCKASTASQTAWALIALIGVGEAHNPAVERGIRFLLETQTATGTWDEPWYTAVGFPRVFYLRYHGYRLFFPLLALARYRNVVERGASPARYGF
jgi:squalene-hopene/tetraprenyl-beta-curcumene cyclase